MHKKKNCKKEKFYPPTPTSPVELYGPFDFDLSLVSVAISGTISSVRLSWPKLTMLSIAKTTVYLTDLSSAKLTVDPTVVSVAISGTIFSV